MTDNKNYEEYLKNDDGNIIYPADDSSSQEEKELHLLTKILNKNKDFFKGEEEPGEEKINELMDATADIRKQVSSEYKARKRKFKLWLVTAIPAAACLALVFSILVLQKPSTTPGLVEVPEDSSPVAYLMDINGSVKLQRGNKTASVEKGSIRLYPSDSVNLSKGASAKIAYPGSVFNVEKGEYKVEDRAEVMLVSDGKSESVKPAVKSAEGESLFTPPDKIAGIVVATVMRGEEHMLVYSPKGKMFSLKPEIIIDGKKDKTYSVSMMSVSGTAAFPPVDINGYRVNWDETDWPSLNYDSVYRLQVRKGNEILTGPELFITTVAEEEAEEIRRQIDSMEEVFNDKNSIRFARANILYQNECFAEARLILKQLHESNPENITYIKMLQYCSKELEFGEEVKRLNEKLDERSL